ncbi:MAG: DNA repair and recombination protein RadA, partial [Candidatus Aenigmarchaeota archaeon]|nr:DNA repair and recombination protein RadA [Candidatus Aenigmarchaeota archaeon]
MEELPGVGPKTAEKLADSGFDDLMSIATASASEIAAIAEVGTGTAAKVIAAARSALDMGFETGLV